LFCFYQYTVKEAITHFASRTCTSACPLL